MQIPVLIEQNSDQQFVATGSAPFSVSAEAATIEEALANLEEKIADRVARGATIALIDVLPAANPWLTGAGMFEGDSHFQAWQDAIAENRRTS